MKRNAFLMVIQILIFIYSISGQESTRKIIKIDLAGKPDQTIKELFESGIDVTAFDRTTKSLNALVTESDIQKISSLSFKTEVILPDADAFARQLRQSGYFDHFHNYQQMLDEMQQAVADHPDLALLEDIGDSYEKTVGRGGYDIWALKISDNVQVEENEPEVFYMANLHAREIITPEIIIYFMHYLIDNYGTDGYATYLVKNRQIWLCPTTNPDGHEYVFSGSTPANGGDPMWWRKNKRDNNNNGIFDPADGVDLNRNFGYKWGYDDLGSSPTPGYETYRGTDPFSEPETQAIRDFVTQHNFIINLSFHSYSQLWLYPWGYTSSVTPDHAIFVALADCCVAYNGYRPEPGYELYTTNGGSDDWFYGEQTSKNKIFGFTPEVGNYAESVNGNTGFFPDTSFIQKQILENQGPMMYLSYVAGEPPIIEHQPFSETESAGPYLITATIKPPLLLTTPVPLDLTSFKLFYNAMGVAPFDSVTLQPTGNLDEYSGSIPSMPSATKIYYYFSVSDQLARLGMLPKGAPLTTFSFKIGADLEAPKINITPLVYASAFKTQYPISAFVTDNIGISSVNLLQLKKDGRTDTLSMSLTSVPDLYQGILIPEDVMVGDTIKYQILAIDNSKNSNTTLMPPTGFFQFYLKNSIIYDFELEPTLQLMTEGDWQWGIPTTGPNSAHSGTKVWATNLVGNYNDFTESTLEIPEISLAGKDSAKLIFWHWYQNEYSENTFWDGGNVKVSVDTGGFQIVTPADGYDGVIDLFNTFLGGEPCFGGLASNGNFWHQETIDLTPYANHSIKVRFHFATDEAINDFGWYIDDVEIEFKQATGLSNNDLPGNLPSTFELKQNYPNPFNPATQIQYHLAQAGEVKLEIYNLLGKKVITLVNEKQSAGAYSLSWKGNDQAGNHVASGVYLYRLAVKGKNFNYAFSRKMVKLQ